jgi:hypothetical protein
MVTIRTKVTLRRRGNLRGHIQKIEKALAGPHKVKVGLPAGKSPADVLQIGVWNHFGTAGSQTNFVRNGVGGFGGPIPPRPFITAAMFRYRGAIRSDLKAAARSIVVNGRPMPAVLELIGEKGKGYVQATMSAGVGAPNVPLTVKIKGSSKQLIDQGRLWDSMTWAYDYGSGSSGVGFSK